MKKYIITIILFTFIGFGIGFFVQKESKSSLLTEKVTQALQLAPTPRPGLPQLLIVPALNISTPIEEVGKDENGAMGTPMNIFNTGWYSFGPRPGEVGNAVIDGHFDTPTGAPSVFYNLHTLQQGDQITIIDEQWKEHQFRVTSVTTYDTSDFPIEEVFGEDDKPRLNLITCAGVWDYLAKDYTDRTVVFAEKVN